MLTKLLILLSILLNPFVNGLRVLHMSDIHIDLKYTIGAPTNCVLGDTGLGCCRNTDIGLTPPGSAGPWGDPHCDSPLPLLNNTLRWIINNAGPIDVILMTGDFVDHHDLSQSWDANRENIQITSNMFSDVFSPLPSPPVIIPILGNHDTYPVDQLIPDITAPTILGDIKNIWSNWLMSDTSRQTFGNCGFYTDLVPRLGDKTRVLVVNSLYYDNNNVAIKSGLQDICSQLEFIQTTVQNAEKANETIWLLGHIPPGSSSCQDSFTQFLQSIMVRYSNTILYNFWGHTHIDELRLYRNSSGPVSSMFIIPSLVPGTNRYPAFRIYTYNTTTKVMENYEQYHCPLSTSTTFPGCSKTYDAVSYYDIPDVTSHSMVGLAQKMADNRTVFDKYSSVVEYPGAGPCCIQSELCDVNYIVHADHALCMSNADRMYSIQFLYVILLIVPGFVYY